MEKSVISRSGEVQASEGFKKTKILLFWVCVEPQSLEEVIKHSVKITSVIS